MACGAALTGLVNSFARVTQGGCPTAVEIRKGTWFAAGQSQLRRSGIVVETSGSTRASSPGGAACSARYRSYGALEFSEPSFYKDATPCMLISIFLVRLQAAREYGAAFPPAGGKAAARAGTFAPGRGCGQNHDRLRPVARPARACWSKLEPLPEHVGGPPTGLVFLQV